VASTKDAPRTSPWQGPANAEGAATRDRIATANSRRTHRRCGQRAQVPQPQWDAPRRAGGPAHGRDVRTIRRTDPQPLRHTNRVARASASRKGASAPLRLRQEGGGRQIRLVGSTATRIAGTHGNASPTSGCKHDEIRRRSPTPRTTRTGARCDPHTVRVGPFEGEGNGGRRAGLTEELDGATIPTIHEQGTPGARVASRTTRSSARTTRNEETARPERERGPSSKAGP